MQTARKEFAPLKRQGEIDMMETSEYLRQAHSQLMALATFTLAVEIVGFVAILAVVS